MRREAMNNLENKDVWIYSETKLPTRFGTFRLVVFRNNHDDKENLAIVKGDISNGKNIKVRLHSECLTSEVLGSLKCDCREQLEAALKTIAKDGQGVVLYLRQEGRGIGLGNKIRAYSLQEAGYDTVQANHILGFPDDLREYDIASAMLKALGIQTIQLMTNNPNKIYGLEEYGIEVKERIPIQIEPNSINRFYLTTKAHKSGHLLNFGQSSVSAFKLLKEVV
jgi:GTP cyclohydrolase II